MHMRIRVLETQQHYEFKDYLFMDKLSPAKLHWKEQFITLIFHSEALPQSHTNVKTDRNSNCGQGILKFF